MSAAGLKLQVPAAAGVDVLAGVGVWVCGTEGVLVMVGVFVEVGDPPVADSVGLRVALGVDVTVDVGVFVGVPVCVGVAVLAGALVCARMVRRGGGAPFIFSSDA